MSENIAVSVIKAGEKRTIDHQIDSSLALDKRLCQRIISNINEGVFIVEKDYTITFFNRAAEEIMGIRASEALGRRCFNLFQTDICHHLCPLKCLASHVPVKHVRVSLLTQGRREVPVNLTTVVVEDGCGNVVGAAELLQDLSEIVHLIDQNISLLSYAVSRTN